MERAAGGSAVAWVELGSAGEEKLDCFAVSIGSGGCEW